MSRYGIPYMGSKSRIADRIVEIFPYADNFYDLFAGGCAVSHCALLSRKFKRIVMNDITDAPQLFVDAINGKYADEKRWISREDFFRLKDEDRYVRICWSFGNDMRTYLYGRDIEPYKKAFHYALFFNDASLLKEYGIDVSDIAVWPYSVMKYYALRDRLKHQRLISAERLGRLHELEGLRFFRQLQSMENVSRLQSLQSLQSRLIVCQSDYRDVEIAPNSVVYADPPYKGVKTNGGVKFDHEAFYDWVRSRDYPVYVSEYAMPDDFECIHEMPLNSTLCATNNGKQVLEKIFVHERWAGKVYRPTLF